MEWQLPGEQDLGHRLLHWAEAHKNHLVIALISGIAFLGLLGGLNLWFHSEENKNQAALLVVVDLAQKKVENKDYDGCISQYEQLYEKAGRQTFFRVLALHGIANCHKAKNEFQKAAEFFERAAKEPGHVAPLASRFEAVQCLKLAGDPKTETAFQELLKEKGLSNELKSKIEEQLLWFRLQKNS